MNARGYLWTGQEACYDTSGREIPCAGSGQDAEYRRGIAWPEPRFALQGETVLDCLTGLVWTRNANLREFPMKWLDALEHVAHMNQANAFGYSDWRLPNRRELRSLMSHQTGRPALNVGHPFLNVFSGWYWSSTTAAFNPACAWYIHMEGARMFFGRKEQYFLLWPVHGDGFGILPATGQTRCFNAGGASASCTGTGQDGELRMGSQWPEPRFEVSGGSVVDRLTNLRWLITANLAGGMVTWKEALDAVGRLDRDSEGGSHWRLPNINELESLVDCSTQGPALPAGHPFVDVREGYWSSTTSMFEPDWAWALYLAKGAVGVGQKWGAHFHVWPVCDAKR